MFTVVTMLPVRDCAQAPPSTSGISTADSTPQATSVSLWVAGDTVTESGAAREGSSVGAESAGVMSADGRCAGSHSLLLAPTAASAGAAFPSGSSAIAPTRAKAPNPAMMQRRPRVCRAASPLGVSSSEDHNDSEHQNDECCGQIGEGLAARLVTSPRKPDLRRAIRAAIRSLGGSV